MEHRENLGIEEVWLSEGDASARLEDSEHFAQNKVEIQVMENRAPIDGIECEVRKWELFGISTL